MTRSVFLGAPVDSPWSDEDRDWALALLTAESQTCSGCGQDIHESHAAENEFAWRAEPMRCHACAEIERATERITDHAGIRYTVRRLP